MLVGVFCTDALSSLVPLPLLLQLLLYLLMLALPADACLLLLLRAHPDDLSRDHCSATMLKRRADVPLMQAVGSLMF